MKNGAADKSLFHR